MQHNQSMNPVNTCTNSLIKSAAGINEFVLDCPPRTQSFAAGYLLLLWKLSVFQSWICLISTHDHPYHHLKVKNYYLIIYNSSFSVTLVLFAINDIYFHENQQRCLTQYLDCYLFLRLFLSNRVKFIISDKPFFFTSLLILNFFYFTWYLLGNNDIDSL